MTAGRPTSKYELRLVDDDDREVPVGDVGEIVVRPREADVMFLGYWNQPEATLAAFRNLWHHTGDSGRADEDGFITFVDRKKDALRRRGENVSSMELEAAIMRHPAIERAAVHAVPSALTEDDIKACIVLRRRCHAHARGHLRVLQGEPALLRRTPLRRGARRPSGQCHGPDHEARPAGRGRHREDLGSGGAWPGDPA